MLYAFIKCSNYLFLVDQDIGGCVFHGLTPFCGSVADARRKRGRIVKGANVMRFLGHLFGGKQKKEQPNFQSVLTDEQRRKANIRVTVSVVDSYNVLNQEQNSEINIAEAKRKAENSFPSKNGLKPHEILMLFYGDGRRVGEYPQQKFWLYKYGVENTEKLIKDLEQKGFLRKSSKRESIESLKTTELKSILNSNSLKVSGKKEELIERVQSSITDEQLEKCEIPIFYKCTDVGNEEIKNGQYIMYAHTHNNWPLPDVWKLNALMQKFPPSQWRTCIWSEYNRELNNAIGKIARCGNYGSYCAVKYEMHKFLIEEQRYFDALSCWIDSRYNEIIHDAVPLYKFYYDKPDRRTLCDLVLTFPLNDTAENDLFFLRSQMGINDFDNSVKKCVLEIDSGEIGASIAEMFIAKLHRNRAEIENRCAYMEYCIKTGSL